MAEIAKEPGVLGVGPASVAVVQVLEHGRLTRRLRPGLNDLAAIDETRIRPPGECQGCAVEKHFQRQGGRVDTVASLRERAVIRDAGLLQVALENLSARFSGEAAENDGIGDRDEPVKPPAAIKHGGALLVRAIDDGRCLRAGIGGGQFEGPFHGILSRQQTHTNRTGKRALGFERADRIAGLFKRGERLFPGSGIRIAALWRHEVLHCECGDRWDLRSGGRDIPGGKPLGQAVNLLYAFLRLVAVDFGIRGVGHDLLVLGLGRRGVRFRQVSLRDAQMGVALEVRRRAGHGQRLLATGTNCREIPGGP